MSKEITSFFKEAPYLKFTMPIPKSDKFVMGLPQSLVMYINSLCYYQSCFNYFMINKRDENNIQYKVDRTTAVDTVPTQNEQEIKTITNKFSKRN